jgi:hypothetical protein
MGKFVLSDTDARFVGDICRSVDGLPLALELAATQVVTLGLRRLAACLNASLQILTNRNRFAEPKQQSVCATLDWSYALLSDEEQEPRRLATFTGEFTLREDIFGGWLLCQMDLAGGTVATRRAGGRVATIAITAMTFHRPVLIGDEVSCYVTVEKIGHICRRAHRIDSRPQPIGVGCRLNEHEPIQHVVANVRFDFKAYMPTGSGPRQRRVEV